MSGMMAGLRWSFDNMNDNTNRPDQDPPENIGGYDVRGKIDYLGPIVWHETQRRPDGTRVTNFESAEVSALPPELTAHQTHVLSSGLIAGVLVEYILPELHRRLGQAIPLDQVLSLPELITKALIIIPPQGAPIVHLNDEAALAEVPAGLAWIRVEREGYAWHLHGNWDSQFPEPVIEDVRATAAQLAEAIVNGAGERAKSWARLSFPGVWADSPKPLREEMHKEIFVLLFGIRQSILKDWRPGSDPLETVKAQFPQAVEDLRKDYSLDTIRAEAQERGTMSDIWLNESLEDMEKLFRKARLSKRELAVVRLEAALAIRNVEWPDEDKEKLHNMRQGTFKSTLHRAREKLRGVGASNPYQRLLEAILQNECKVGSRKV